MTTTELPFAPGALLVSCQARPDNPLHGPDPMALMARAARAGGAAGIRADGAADVAAIAAAIDLPVIGIDKSGDPQGVHITPTFEAAASVARAGADVVALDGTGRPRPGGVTLPALVAAIHERLGVLVMADVDDLAAGLAAREAGADLVASTLSGYTPATRTAPGDPGGDGPDVELVAALAARLDVPVVAEGRYRTREDVAAALDAGAYAVVVGTAVTNPMAITRRLVEYAARTPTNAR